MIRIAFTAAAALMAAAVCVPAASAQEMSCDLTKLCKSDHVFYDPEFKEGFALFGGVLVYFDGHQLRKIVETPLAEMDEVYVEIGNCKMDVLQPHTPFPTADEEPEFRRNMARNTIEALQAGMKKLSSVLSVSEPRLVKDEPGIVQYQVVSERVGSAGSGTVTEVRRVSVGYYQTIQKWCESPDEETAQANYDSHRVSLPTAKPAS